MQGKLASRLKPRERTAAKNAGVRGPSIRFTNVMVAGSRNFNVIYTTAVASMLRDAEADIRKDLPNFSAAHLHGAGGCALEKNPSADRGCLVACTGTHNAGFAGETHRSRLVPIRCGHARRPRRHGLEWTDRSPKCCGRRNAKHAVGRCCSGDSKRRLALEDKGADSSRHEQRVKTNAGATT